MRGGIIRVMGDAEDRVLLVQDDGSGGLFWNTGRQLVSAMANVTVSSFRKRNVHLDDLIRVCVFPRAIF